MSRITETMLRRKVQHLNELTGSPVEYMNEQRHTAGPFRLAPDAPQLGD